MTDQSTGPLQQLQEHAPVSNGAASSKMPLVAVPMLTMSRGTRPLIIRRPANGGLHDNRRRSA